MVIKEIGLQEMQGIELDILKYFKSVCVEHDLQYFLAYGTLLGAVRHQGFIPWDDDIDVMMPREDYNRLVEILKENRHPYYKLISIETFPNFTAPLPKIIDTRTELIQHYDFIEKVKLGVYIDIFILDGAADDYETAIKRYHDSYQIYRRWMRADSKLFKPGKSKIYGFLRLIRNIPYKIRGIIYYINKITLYNSQNSFYKTDYVAAFTCGIEDAFVSVYGKDSFGEGCQLRFVDEDFCVPQDYDNILKVRYGNYMELPPESKRKSHHKYTVKYINESNY